jgi:hypothetical protein
MPFLSLSKPILSAFLAFDRKALSVLLLKKLKSMTFFQALLMKN